jgi:glycosyltransferase involved in cell wall biosynthesis
MSDSESANLTGFRYELSVIIPVYMNELSLRDVISRLESIALTTSMEAVFVVDGSPDRSFELLAMELPTTTFSSQLLNHSRNFGSFPALKTGMNVARGRILAMMAADLQEPEELVPELYASLKDGTYDVALATRTARADSLPDRLSSSVFWYLYRRFVQPNMPNGGVDVFACNSRVCQALLRLNESNSSLVGQLLWIGFSVVNVPYARQPRLHGKSQWTFRKKSRYMLDSIFAFTDLPMLLILWLGVTGSLTVLVISAVIAIAWLRGHIPVLGYTPLMLTILFATFVLQTSLGVIGGYVWRCFENTKSRPWALVTQHQRIDHNK